MDFYTEIAKLKSTERRGWIQSKVPGRIESDAEHTFSMCMLALDFMNKNDLKLDQLKVLKMCLYHELGEIKAGDIIQEDNITMESKYQMEYDGVKEISTACALPEIETLWLEFEQGTTDEAKFVRMLDKYDSVMQAGIYKNQFGLNDVYNEFSEHYSDVCEKLGKLKK